MKPDPIASTHNLSASFISPIAGRTIEGIEKYVGKVYPIEKYPGKAFIVEFERYAEPNPSEIWKVDRSFFINCKKQLWVHVDFRKYRSAYIETFPEYEITRNIFIDHLMNRRLARVFNYPYIRLVHVDADVNTSSGVGQEDLSITGHDRVEEVRKEQQHQQIQYADPFDISKMLNMKTGSQPFEDVIDLMPHLY
ncbi:MAG: hypothetical protein V2A54_16425 [Bacteroidota bacterium]